jgi:hypothetical protein
MAVRSTADVPVRVCLQLELLGQFSFEARFRRFASLQVAAGDGGCARIDGLAVAAALDEEAPSLTSMNATHSRGSSVIEQP